MIYCEFPPRKRPLAIVGQEVITVDNLENSEDGNRAFTRLSSPFSVRGHKLVIFYLLCLLWKIIVMNLVPIEESLIKSYSQYTSKCWN
jgi:hypothetical protein